MDRLIVIVDIAAYATGASVFVAGPFGWDDGHRELRSVLREARGLRGINPVAITVTGVQYRMLLDPATAPYVMGLRFPAWQVEETLARSPLASGAVLA